VAVLGWTFEYLCGEHTVGKLTSSLAESTRRIF